MEQHGSGAGADASDVEVAEKPASDQPTGEHERRSPERRESDDVAPGEDAYDRGRHSVGERIRIYVYGFALAALLTTASFLVAGTDTFVYEPAVPALLIVLAIGQMGVHLVFFLHINTAPDSTNNVLALAFGILIVALVIIGSVWIMGHLNHNMMPMSPDQDPRIDGMVMPVHP